MKMFFVILFLFILNLSFSQSSPINKFDSYSIESLPKKIDFGFFVGPKFTNRTDSPFAHSESTFNNFGIVLGIIANIRLSEHFNIDLTPSLSFDDYKYQTFWGSTNRVDETMLNAPIMLGYGFNTVKHHPHVFIGGNFQYDLSMDPRYNEPTRSLLTAGLGIEKKLRYFTFAPRVVYGRTTDINQVTLQLVLRG